jgi:hypothetical protein
MTPIQENVGLFVVGLDGDGAAEEIPFYHTVRLVSSGAEKILKNSCLAVWSLLSVRFG